MGETAFRSEDRIGLAGAVALHVALVVALALQLAFMTPRDITPERMTVSLATEVSLRSTAPDPVPESRAAIAPTLAEDPAPQVDETSGETAEVAPPPPPPPTTRTVAREEPRTPAPERARSRPDRQPEAPARTAENSGGSRHCAGQE